MRNPQVTIDGTPINVYRFVVDAENRYKHLRHNGEIAQRLLKTGRLAGSLPDYPPGSYWQRLNDVEVEFRVVVGVDVALTIDVADPPLDLIVPGKRYIIDWTENVLGPVAGCALQKSSFGFGQAGVAASYTLTAFVEV